MKLLIVFLALLVLIAVWDLIQRKHTIRRNFPLVGHLRYLLESLGPELRQYIVASNDEERPFSRDERRWVYASAKVQNNYFGFGTDNDLERSPGYLVIPHATLAPSGGVHRAPSDRLPCAKVLGAARGREKAFRMRSVIGVSAMSFGSLSARAVEAMNRGCAMADALHNTGEGGVASHHDHGAGLVWQIGTGYFGCRNDQGAFDRARFLDTVAAHDVRAIEIKLSQGAKPGHGGILPAAKVTADIGRARGVSPGTDCLSPAGHSAFRDEDELLDFVENLAEATGLPVGIKSAVGDMGFWGRLCRFMSSGDRGVDFVSIDGGEGGTGAAPLVFADHVAFPFKVGMSRVYRVFAENDLCEKVVFIGSGKLGFPDKALFAFALGCDAVSVAREAMMSVGCIQAQLCHSGHCPSGVATQSKWLMRGLDPTDKSARLANYLKTFRKELLSLSHACGVSHPSLVGAERLELLDERFGSVSVRSHFGYEKGWGLPSKERAIETEKLMSGELS